MNDNNDEYGGREQWTGKMSIVQYIACEAHTELELYLCMWLDSRGCGGASMGVWRRRRRSGQGGGRKCDIGRI
jgi:hypothetical protein